MLTIYLSLEKHLHLIKMPNMDHTELGLCDGTISQEHGEDLINLTSSAQLLFPAAMDQAHCNLVSILLVMAVTSVRVSGRCRFLRCLQHLPSQFFLLDSDLIVATPWWCLLYYDATLTLHFSQTHGDILELVGTCKKGIFFRFGNSFKIKSYFETQQIKSDAIKITYEVLLVFPQNHHRHSAMYQSLHSALNLWLWKHQQTPRKPLLRWILL